MELDHWTELSRAIKHVAKQWLDPPHYQHPTHVIALVYCWAAIHNCSVNWACEPLNWTGHRRPDVSLPDQSTMSRRTRRDDFRRFLEAVGKSLAWDDNATLTLLKLDGKPLPVAAHSTDTHATFGRGAGQKARGYKLHTLWGGQAMPIAWRVAPLNVCEKTIAQRMLRELRVKHPDRAGYLLADGYYDSSPLFDDAAAANLQLLSPRQHPCAGLGHHYQSPHRKRSIQMLESPETLNTFGKELYGERRQIEREYGNLTGFGGGLIALPAWVRRYWRVRNWVHAKLLINACRIRCLRRRRQKVA